MAKENEKEVDELVKVLNQNKIFKISVVCLVLAVLILGGFSVYAYPYVIGSSTSTVKSNVMTYVTNVGIPNVTVLDINKVGKFYEVFIEVKGQRTSIFTTLDGKYMVPQVIPLLEKPQINTQTQQQEEIPKSDKPKVELFVMTHCPYGTQAERGMLPAIEKLGNNIDFKIRFVGYFMHGDKEEKETYTQICIREEQADKYYSYLKCFLSSAGDSDATTTCLGQAKVDKAKLTDCMNTKAKDYYASDKALGDKYGVQGSPTLIINEVQSQAGRSSDSYLKGICSAFNNQPSVCDEDLDTAQPATGFGSSTAGGSGGSCG